MSWTWELYQDVNGEIPKDLLAFFIRMIPEQEQPENPPKPLLSASETKRLQVNLGYLCNKGLASLTSGIFEKLEDDLYELRMTKSEHNPRFILTAATPQRFVVLHAFMKKYDDGIKDRDKEPARVRLRELQQRNHEKT
ncbi:type II toxin-antitoxin system RelE/ParE family toxin [Nostoc sp. FACHB-973]|uniref:Type II toxin-antitoxin system RelE/ParE family toxin n=1 Tax=Desmonostoc muscorum LEGE 12446 TaxID=1828758 RepID=A0A8J7AGN5_DESMC|nr:type II toxin-antitoxin system RelE/ParE family toxin [Desmonostoc muscorum]MBD2516347.1 type II toxin-antitoxin system RelE/ParE family toxin [Nostoc sp. FACHB-973]MBX9256345.1 type II toxin-antitoxin system RelE/ParE family toxin [Desmonostoc muscorum CCALA 125]MCF2145943.1 type II toxin-antitoxin system RelE/ParE family toxin [Desmonostoc muscorum LEGE 12446]